MRLEVLPGLFSVCRLAADAPVPSSFFSLTRTAEELSVVCAAGSEPSGGRVESGWSCLRVAGTLDFALTGILASIASPLAREGVSIFALSTFDTDYVLVREIEKAREALRSAGFVVT